MRLKHEIIMPCSNSSYARQTSHYFLTSMSTVIIVTPTELFSLALVHWTNDKCHMFIIFLRLPSADTIRTAWSHLTSLTMTSIMQRNSHIACIHLPLSSSPSIFYYRTHWRIVAEFFHITTRYYRSPTKLEVAQMSPFSIHSSTPNV